MIRHQAQPLLAAVCLLGLAGCGGKQEEGGRTSPPAEPGAAYFSPRPGEVWKYRVQKEIPIGLRLAKNDAARRPQRTDNAHLITFEQVRTCTGTRVLENTDKSLTGISISENGEKLGEELYQIGPEGLLSWGWVPANMKDKDVKLLPEGVPIATTGMQPGESWECVGTNGDNPFLFRVIEQGRVTVPAGTFHASRIQITSEKISPHPVTGKDHVTYLKRSLWFAEEVGVIKEEIVYYGEQNVRVKQRSELVHWTTPSSETNPEAAMVNTTGEPFPLPDEHRQEQ